METNRIASFPAEAPHEPNNHYFYAKIQAVALAGSFFAGVALLLSRGTDNMYAQVMVASAAIQVIAFIAQLVMARRKTNRRVAEYRKQNPDVELTHGP